MNKLMLSAAALMCGTIVFAQTNQSTVNQTGNGNGSGVIQTGLTNNSDVLQTGNENNSDVYHAKLD